VRHIKNVVRMMTEHGHQFSPSMWVRSYLQVRVL
jgi:hypothetical protein